MFINASKNFNLNITWAASFTGTYRCRARWDVAGKPRPHHTFDPGESVFMGCLLDLTDLFQ